MKELKKNPLDLNTIEFWASTSLYVFSVFVLITQANYGGSYKAQYDNHYSNISGIAAFVPRAGRYTILYITFLAFNFQISPGIVKQKNVPLNVIYAALLFALVCAAYAVTDTYLEPRFIKFHPSHFYFSRSIFAHALVQSVWVFMILSFYILIKHASVYLLSHLQKIEPQFYQVTREAIIGLIGCMVLILLLISTNTHAGVIVVVGFSIILAIGIYWSSAYWIIPDIKRRGQDFKMYMVRIVLLVACCAIPVSILATNIESHSGIIILLFNTPFQLLIVAPVSWQVYRYRSASNAELYRLKTELGQTSAGYNMLQAQINPHFLFNALNTLYGTALQENAERTGEGIQQLGDMMRFMLHENMQQSISLTREIDYLHHFIALQKLRTQTSPDIVIQSEIPDYTGSLHITPMLLIPFVENAFKHGISLREPSHIKITLHVQGNTLYFDVYNSIHVKPDNDPEKGYSGIGLNNLKQRLNLLYAKKHDLIIRETTNEFFVHLTLQLKGNTVNAQAPI
ncbi:sensor histidine kinase [Mucilaginibacter sp. AW1-3]